MKTVFCLGDVKNSHDEINVTVNGETKQLSKENKEIFFNHDKLSIQAEITYKRDGVFGESRPKNPFARIFAYILFAVVGFILSVFMFFIGFHEHIKYFDRLKALNPFEIKKTVTFIPKGKIILSFIPPEYSTEQNDYSYPDFSLSNVEITEENNNIAFRADYMKSEFFAESYVFYSAIYLISVLFVVFSVYILAFRLINQPLLGIVGIIFSAVVMLTLSGFVFNHAVKSYRLYKLLMAKLSEKFNI